MPPPAFALLIAVALSPPTRAPGPTLATEDTMHTEVSEVLVRAPRVTLDEILDRVARGEAHRDSLIADQSFTATTRLVRNVVGRKPPQLFEETVYRVYRKRPDKVRTLVLRDWKAKPDKKHNDDDRAVNASFSPRTSEEIVNFAFRPAARREFNYHIAGRDLVGDHLVYRIAFEPKSPIDPLGPNGLVWVDTNEFVIVREEVGFRHSPVPLILKSIPRMVVERRRIEDIWVLSRVLMRAEFTLPIPGFGSSLDFSMFYDDYALNSGLADSLFPARGARR